MAQATLKKTDEKVATGEVEDKADVKTVEDQAPAAPLRRQNFARLEHACIIHNAVIPYGVTVKQALEEGFWANVANGVNMYDEIRMLAEDGSWLARAIVYDKHPRFLVLRLLEYYEFEVVRPLGAVFTKDDLSVVYRGPVLLHCIMRGDEVIKSKIAKRADAMQELEQYLRALGR